ncbi:fimbrial protein [Vibrio xuii]|nr:fimbrial protein [Vibrio xuii]
MIRKDSCKLRKKEVKGMTLIELILVVAIIAVLASIAYPSYQQHVLKAHRIAALSDLAKVQLELERNYQGSYVSAAQAALPGGVCHFCNLDQEQFELSVSSALTSYTITATAKGSQTKDECAGSRYSALTLNSIGQHTPSNCWQ